MAVITVLMTGNIQSDLVMISTWKWHGKSLFQHPITRWIARYLLDPPEKDYEKELAILDVEAKKTELRYVI